MCALRVSTYMRGKWYRDLDVEAHQELSGYALYESVLTYVAQSGSHRRSASRYLPRARVRDTHY